MSTLIVEILFIWVAFIIGVFQDNFKDIIKGILSGNWTEVVVGMSASGTFIVLGILLSISVIIFFIRRKELENEKSQRYFNKLLLRN